MCELKDLQLPDNWQNAIYEEAWRQYCHEDNLGQSRTNFFLGVQAALLAILTLALNPLLNIQPISVKGHQLYIGLAVLGVLSAVVGTFLLILTKYWKEVTEAGRLYLNLRWIPIWAIETIAGLDRVSLARLEDAWKSFSEANPGENFYPYSDIRELHKMYLKPLPKIREWSSMEKTITLMQVIYWLIVIVGCVLLMTAVILSAL